MKQNDKIFWTVTVFLVIGIAVNGYFMIRDQLFPVNRGKEVFCPNEYVGVFADMAEPTETEGSMEGTSSGISIVDAKPFVSGLQKLPAELTSTGETNGSVLIYHTHTNEAYLKTEEERARAQYAGRSNDAEYTVVKAGNALTEALEHYGISVDHDIRNNEVNGYNRCYATSMSNIAALSQQNGKYSLYIDLHRDSYSANVSPTVTIDGKEVAKIMLVVGKKAPGYESNVRIANALMERLNQIHPQLCERVLEADTYYNQNISDHALLIEVGDNAVTAEEASRAAEYIARALAEIKGSLW